MITASADGPKWVVVTGAAGGIGSVCTRRLQEQGYAVLGVDISPCPGDATVEVDLEDQAGIDAVGAAVEGIERLHGLVNNAAVSTDQPTRELTSEIWDRIFAVNVRAAFSLAEALVNRMPPGGSVVNLASVHAFATSAGAVPYAASKGAIVAMTRALAIDWAHRGLGVRVNAVAPAAVDTPMLRDGLARTGVSLDDLALRHPLGRVARPEEVSDVIAFLLGPDSSFMTGTTVHVDGGALAHLSTEVP